MTTYRLEVRNAEPGGLLGVVLATNAGFTRVAEVYMMNTLRALKSAVRTDYGRGVEVVDIRSAA